MRKLAVSAAALAAMTGSALAADVVLPPPPPPPAPVLFDWAGPYAGVYGGVIIGSLLEVGGTVGYNFVPGMVVGVEGQVGFGFGAGLEAAVSTRFGAIVGAEDLGLLYAEVTAGVIAGTFFWATGGGVAFGIGDSTSVFFETKAIGGGGCCGIQLQGGVNFHFN